MPQAQPERIRFFPPPAEAGQRALERELRLAVGGEVRFDAASRALYATDASNYRQVPIGVVIPRTLEDVVQTVAACRRHGAPILSRGAGTSLSGQCCNVAVVLDFSKYLNRILGIDPIGKTARVEPGVVLDDLRQAANRHGLTFAPDPATHSHNTLGGMIGNNSCGPHSVMGGETVHNVIELDVLTYDGLRLRVGATGAGEVANLAAGGGRQGEIYQRLWALAERYGGDIRRRFPAIPRRVSGFNLPALLPEQGFNLARALVGSEGTCVLVLEAKLRLVDWPAARSLLVLGYPSVFEAADRVGEVMAAGPIALEGMDDRLVADIEAAGIAANPRRLLPEGGGWLLAEFGGPDRKSADGIGRYREFIQAAARLATGLGGSVSGEHGDGQAKAELLPIMFGDEIMAAFREFKAIWDPDNRMNPGKLIDAARADEHLRLGPAYSPARPETRFAYGADRGDFARVLLRCVGVGECRKKSGGVMCPSYMATGEEMHSTRGRARLLFEMLGGETLGGGWREPAVKEALDLCLSCKGCKGECPVQVDMATYKAEFLSHYYQGRLRPPAAYAFGLIDRWARLASHAPGAVNFLLGHQPVAGLVRGIAGIARQRRLPRFAREPFTQAFRRYPLAAGGRRVLLWPDTFNNYFQPEVARAAAEVLAHAGFAVCIPDRHLCCGRPLYEFGMVDRARRYLLRLLESLRSEIRAGIPVVGLEPACLSVFREELPELLPGDEDAGRLSRQVFHLSEFLEQQAPGFPFGPLQGPALVHGHCHHQAILGMAAEAAVLRKLGLDCDILDAGCCGMAGSFGFEKDKYDVSLRCGERVLLPAVRAAPADALIVADGYSCRQQIGHATQRRPLHLAEVLKLAMQGK